MQLTTSSVPSHLRRTGTDQIILPAGTRLKIETSPSGTEILDVEVPAGKEWNTYIMVSVDETDV